MRTLEFTHSLKQIVGDLQVQQLHDTLARWISGPPNTPHSNISEDERHKFTALVVASSTGFDLLSKRPATAKILEGLHIQDFYEPGRLTRMITSVAGANTTQVIRPNVELQGFLQRLASVLQLTSTCESLLEDEKIGKPEPDDSLFELQLVDYDGKGIEPSRLQLVISSVVRLHMIFSKVYAVEGDQLRFKYFDSGSALVIGITCATPVALGIAKLLLDWWKETRFSDFDSFDKKIGVVSKSLTTLADIKTAVEKNIITEEAGKNYSRRVLVEVNRLVGLGATVPLEEAASIDQRERLVGLRNQKLLESAKVIEEDDAEENAG
jgi:hypothetical protein